MGHTQSKPYDISLYNHTGYQNRYRYYVDLGHGIYTIFDEGVVAVMFIRTTNYSITLFNKQVTQKMKQ